MTHKFIIAGFGGQGVLRSGQFLAYAGMNEGKEVSWLPSYGPEMRGGTANCSVIISTKKVAAPIIANPTCLVALNPPSLTKFIENVEKGGLVLVNSSLISEKVTRQDVKTYYLPANEMAIEAGNVKAANMVMVGAIVKLTKCVKLETVYDCIEEDFKSKPKLVELNKKVVKMAYDYVK